MKNISVVLSPGELPALGQANLGGTSCVVFDVLRATSTFVTALHNGARRIIPVSEIPEALAWRQREPEVLLAGERRGVKIGAALTGGVTFDLGNSPREFTAEKVRGKTIVSTTTNGTRALNACRGAHTVLAGSLLNLDATARFILANSARRVLLVCAGTGENPALEDVLAAGALCQRLAASRAGFVLCDSAAIAWRTFRQAEADLALVMRTTENGGRLMAIPELAPDVAYCSQIDVFELVVCQIDDALIAIRT